MPKAGNTWTRDEHILEFNLYSQLPFGKMHKGTPQIIELARLLGRTDSSVAFKLSNFARLDPALQERGIRGMQHGAKGEEEVWREFYAHPEELAFESEGLLAKRLYKPVEEVAEIDVKDLPPEGKEREAIVRVRVNQNFFRRRIISAFEFRCCVTGLAVRDLLVASHIVPWARAYFSRSFLKSAKRGTRAVVCSRSAAEFSTEIGSKDPVHRLNPRNGLCLNALHGRAFDRGMMWVDNGFVIRFSDRLHAAARKQEEPTLQWLTGFEGKPLYLPKRFAPDPELLQRHASTCAG